MVLFLNSHPFFQYFSFHPAIMILIIEPFWGVMLQKSKHYGDKDSAISSDLYFSWFGFESLSILRYKNTQEYCIQICTWIFLPMSFYMLLHVISLNKSPAMMIKLLFKNFVKWMKILPLITYINWRLLILKYISVFLQHHHQ